MTLTNLHTRNARIDFMRGIAILLVLFQHFHLSYLLSQSALNKVFSTDFINVIANNGNYGVTMFFVISGYLITSTTIERYKSLGTMDPLGFYIFRFARIMPCLILAIALISILNYFGLVIFKNKPISTISYFMGIFSVLTFWHNVLMEKAGWFNYCLNVYWSLSVEEVFYFSFPLICLFFKKIRFIILFWLMFIIIAPIYRYYNRTDEIASVYGYLGCFDAIAMGCITAVIAPKIKLSALRKSALKWLAAAVILIVMYFYNGIPEKSIAILFTLVAVSTAILLITFQTEQPVNSLMKSIGWFGKNSYELYLFHIIVLALMKTVCKPQMLNDYTKLIWLGLFILFSSVIAGAIEKFYSRPLNSKIRRFLLNIRLQKLSSTPETAKIIN